MPYSHFIGPGTGPSDRARFRIAMVVPVPVPVTVPVAKFGSGRVLIVYNKILKICPKILRRSSHQISIDYIHMKQLRDIRVFCGWWLTHFFSEQ